VFANAGLADFAPIGSITEEHFDKIFGTNVKGLCLPRRRRCR
jgi:NAD(P)-dependent dehydrogenase (short-subunit alcohol dehydrogenase family)